MKILQIQDFLRFKLFIKFSSESKKSGQVL